MGHDVSKYSWVTMLENSTICAKDELTGNSDGISTFDPILFGSAISK